MNGKPLTKEHGAPLRLILPHKYGIKNIKLITHLAYTTTRPPDYWEEQGYDWYAGL
jgi:DMSO/TMAO reductase YedYZ molybdopterin-dependent catalytic subunit